MSPSMEGKIKSPVESELNSKSWSSPKNCNISLVDKEFHNSTGNTQRLERDYISVFMTSHHQATHSHTIDFVNKSPHSRLKQSFAETGIRINLDRCRQT